MFIIEVLFIVDGFGDNFSPFREIILHDQMGVVQLEILRN